MIFYIKTTDPIPMEEGILFSDVSRFSAKQYGDDVMLSIVSKSGNSDTHNVQPEEYERFKIEFDVYLRTAHKTAVDGKISVAMLEDIKQAAEKQAMDTVSEIVSDITKNLVDVSQQVTNELTNVSGALVTASDDVRSMTKKIDEFPSHVQKAHEESAKVIKSNIEAVVKPIHNLGDASEKLTDVANALSSIALGD